MQYKQPENLKDMLELQKVLDNSIENIRPRLLEDIRLSMIAEIIEFNEETKYSHKTWKTKPYDREKELEELVDVWFFMAQFINNKIDDVVRENILYKNFNKWDIEITADIQDLIKVLFTSSSTRTKLYYLIGITNKFEYSKQDILIGYWKKWQKNMKRIGKEWN